MKKYTRITFLSFFLLSYPVTDFAASTENLFGFWGSVTLNGDFSFLSSDLDKLKWNIMNQSRTRDYPSKGSTFSENLLFSQVGYQVTDNASFWLGYVHDWIHPLNKPAVQESRPYQDFLWKQNFDEFHFMARSRFEQRINQTSGNVGYRARQLLQISHPLGFVDGLSMYLGDEVLFYVNKTTFGKQGFSENRIFSGLSYDFTKSVGMDLGYLGQYVDNTRGSNLFTHNLQANIRFNF